MAPPLCPSSHRGERTPLGGEPPAQHHPAAPRAGGGDETWVLSSPLSLPTRPPSGFPATTRKAPKQGQCANNGRQPRTGGHRDYAYGTDPQPRAPGQANRKHSRSATRRPRNSSRATGRGAWHSGRAGPLSPPRGGPQPHHHHPARVSEESSIASSDPKPPLPAMTPQGRAGGERGRAGFRTPAFHAPPSGGAERRGARRQREKSGPIRHECPSLAWRSLGPAQESAHPPHRSQRREERGEKRQELRGGGAWQGHSRRARFQPHQCHTPPHRQRPTTTQSSECLTRKKRHGATHEGRLGPPSVPTTGSAQGAREDPQRHHPRHPRVLETGGGTELGEATLGRARAGARAPGRTAHGRERQGSKHRGTVSKNPEPQNSPSGRHRPLFFFFLLCLLSSGNYRKTACQHTPADTKRPSLAKGSVTHGSRDSPPQHTHPPKQGTGEAALQTTPRLQATEHPEPTGRPGGGDPQANAPSTPTPSHPLAPAVPRGPLKHEGLRETDHRQGRAGPCGHRGPLGPGGRAPLPRRTLVPVLEPNRQSLTERSRPAPPNTGTHSG